MTAPAQPPDDRFSRRLLLARLALLGVIAASLVAGAVGDVPRWLTAVMLLMALGIGAARINQLLRDPQAKPSPLAQLWRRTDRGERREHTGDWW